MVSEMFGLEVILSKVIEKVVMTLMYERAAQACLDNLQDIMRYQPAKTEGCPDFQKRTFK